MAHSPGRVAELIGMKTLEVTRRERRRRASTRKKARLDCHVRLAQVLDQGSEIIRRKGLVVLELICDVKHSPGSRRKARLPFFQFEGATLGLNLG